MLPHSHIQGKPPPTTPRELCRPPGPQLRPCQRLPSFPCSFLLWLRRSHSVAARPAGCHCCPLAGVAFPNHLSDCRWSRYCSFPCWSCCCRPSWLLLLLPSSWASDRCKLLRASSTLGHSMAHSSLSDMCQWNLRQGARLKLALTLLKKGTARHDE